MALADGGKEIRPGGSDGQAGVGVPKGNSPCAAAHCYCYAPAVHTPVTPLSGGLQPRCPCVPQCAGRVPRAISQDRGGSQRTMPLLWAQTACP